MKSRDDQTGLDDDSRHLFDCKNIASYCCANCKGGSLTQPLPCNYHGRPGEPGTRPKPGCGAYSSRLPPACQNESTPRTRSYQCYRIKGKPTSSNAPQDRGCESIHRGSLTWQRLPGPISCGVRCQPPLPRCQKQPGRSSGAGNGDTRCHPRPGGQPVSGRVLSIPSVRGAEFSVRCCLCPAQRNPTACPRIYEGTCNTRRNI